MASEQRTERRAPVVLRIKLRYQSVDNFIEKFATNISRGGMFISSRKPKPVGTEIRFELRLADDAAIIAGTGVVRWTKEFDPDKPRKLHGMGIEYTELDDRSVELLDRILAHKRSLGLPDDDEIPRAKRRKRRSAKVAAAEKAAEEAASAVPEPVAAIESEPIAAPKTEAEPESDAAPRARRVTAEELIARVTAASPEVDYSELAALFEDDGASNADLGRALTRARELARGGDGADADEELDALLKVTAAPTANSARDATEQLAAMLGTAAPAVRVKREVEPEPDVAPEPEPDVAPEPEPDVAPEAEAKAETETATEAEAETEAEAVEDEDDFPEIELDAEAPSEPSTTGVRESTIELDIDSMVDDLIMEEAEPVSVQPPPPPRPPPPPPAAMRKGERDESQPGPDYLDADVLDADALMGSGLDQLTSRRAPSGQVSQTPPDLSSFADPPPTMPPAASGSDEMSDIDDALAALEGDGGTLVQDEPAAAVEEGTVVQQSPHGFDDELDIEISGFDDDEDDNTTVEAPAQVAVPPEGGVDAVAVDPETGEPIDDEATEGDDEEGGKKKKGLFKRMFGRGKKG